MGTKAGQKIKERLEKVAQWKEAIDFLISTRYAIRENRKPIEHSYEEVIERIIAGIEPKKLDRVLDDGFKHAFWQAFEPHLEGLVTRLRERFVIPSTPILMNFNARTKHGGTFACYPMIPPKDSLDDIFAVAHRMAKVFKCGGGAGIGMSNLRPSGAPVDNEQGIASGPASFTKFYAAVADVVSQGARRRGALMAWLWSDHPDWRAFISLKDHIDFADDHPLNSVNISLAVKDTPSFLRSEQLKEVAEHAWKTGDPGLLFTDIHLAKTPIPAQFEPFHVNPCVTGDTLLFTGRRWVRADKAFSEPVVVDSMRLWKVGVKECVRVTFKSGFCIKCTPDHRFMVEGREWVEARDLRGRKVPVTVPELVPAIPSVRFSAEEWQMMTKDGKIIYPEQMGDIYAQLAWLRKAFYYTWMTYPKQRWISFVKYAGRHAGDVEDALVYALRMIGIRASAPHVGFIVVHPDDFDALYKFVNDGEVDFDRIEELMDDVVDVVEIGEDYVYDFQMMRPENYTFGNGCIIHNCGEYQSVAGTVCNLLTINTLASAFASDGAEDKFLENIFWSAFYAAMFGNFIIFAGGYPEPSFKYKTWLWRPVGIGLTGLHESMIYFGIDYESDEGVEFTRKVQRNILFGTLNASATLASVIWDMIPTDMPNDSELEHYHSDTYVDEWPFDDWIPKKLPVHADRMLCGLTRDDLDFPWEDHAYDLVRKTLDAHGCLFNCVTTSQAPTGSVSIFAGCGSTGVEPLWAKEWERMMKDLDGTPRYFKLRSLVADMIDRLKPAIEISPDAQLRIMKAVQDYCHTAVSKTVNLPNSATVEDIIRIFKQAAQDGLKSLTVYRDRCRAVQVLRSTEEEKTREEGTWEDPTGLADKVGVRQGMTIPARGTKTLYFTLNRFFEEDPRVYEVFAVGGKSGSALLSYLEALGRLVSAMLQRDPDAIQVIVKTLSGIDAGEFYKLPGVETPARSGPEALALALLHYGVVREDTKKELLDGGGDICPECGKATFMRQGGCRCCKNCGYSTC